LNGKYEGDGVRCRDSSCPPPARGACCLPSGRCVPLTEEVCERIGGSYQGDDARCIDSDCPAPTRGACCLPRDRCAVIPEAICDRLGGRYEGDGTRCEDACSENSMIVPSGSLDMTDLGTPCVGDVDGDGQVAIDDLALELAAFGSCSEMSTYQPLGDFDGNGCNDMADLAQLLSRFGERCD